MTDKNNGGPISTLLIIGLVVSTVISCNSGDTVQSSAAAAGGSRYQLIERIEVDGGFDVEIYAWRDGANNCEWLMARDGRGLTMQLRRTGCGR